MDELDRKFEHVFSYDNTERLTAVDSVRAQIARLLPTVDIQGMCVEDSIISFKIAEDDPSPEAGTTFQQPFIKINLGQDDYPLLGVDWEYCVTIDTIQPSSDVNEFALSTVEYVVTPSGDMLKLERAIADHLSDCSLDYFNKSIDTVRQGGVLPPISYEDTQLIEEMLNCVRNTRLEVDMGQNGQPATVEEINSLAVLLARSHVVNNVSE